MTQIQEQASTTPSEPAKARLPRGIPWAAIAAAAALALVAWNYWETRQAVSTLEQALAQRLSDADARTKQNQALADKTSEAVRELQGKLAVVENKLAESQNQQIALEALYQELSRNRDEWSLAEIEQILTIANQQLELAGNVSAALVALQAADTRLQRIDKAHLAGLRRVIDQDIQRLKALPFIDTVGISVKLDNLAVAVDVMPLLVDRPRHGALPPETSSQASTGFWVRFTSAALDQLKDVIRVQRLDKGEPPLLSPDQAFFLRENLKLRLLSARLALLAHDEVSYRADLNGAAQWLNRFFDLNSKGVRNALAQLRQLVQSPIGIATAGLSASLEAVRDHKLASRAGAR